MSRINVLWVIDHVCYDGSLHGGGRLYWNVLPEFDTERFRIVPCMLRASETIREVFRSSPVRVRILDKAKFDPTTLWTFLQLIKEENIHVMHLHCYGASTFGRLASLMTSVPAIIHDYDTEVYFPYPSYLGLADRLLAPRTPAAVATSPMVRSFLNRKRKIETARILTIFHAVPTEKFDLDSGEVQRRARERLGIRQDARVFCTVTKLGPQRGNEYLLEAAREVMNEVPDAILLIVYRATRFHRLPDKRYVEVSSVETDNQIAKLRLLASELGIEKRVRFIECAENVDELVSASDVFVAPFLSERFSSVNLLEAMAMGKPVIATDVGEQRELIQSGVNGYLVTPGDVKELAAAIVNTLADPEDLAQVSRRAKVTAEQHSAGACAEKLQNLYLDLVANGVAAGRR